MSVRVAALVALLTLASPLAAAEIVPPADPLHAAVLAAATASVADELGLPVQLHASELRAGDGFAFLSANVTHPDGSAIDFRQTPYADAVEDGLFDGPHLWALLREDDGAWTVLEQDIGPTDAWYAGWPSAHGAACDLIFDGFTGC